MSARGDVLTWLEKVIGEREDMARAAEAISPSPWAAGRGEGAAVMHMAVNDPESVLRRCAVDRQILGLCSAETTETGGRPLAMRIVRAMAEGYGWTEETSLTSAQGQTPPIEGDRVT